MPRNCPTCCRTLEEIERLVPQMEDITSKYVTNVDQREAVQKILKRIVNVSREAREAECREG